MGIFNFKGSGKKKSVGKRSLAALVGNRFRSNWMLAGADPNAVGQQAKTVRQMARDLEESNAYVIAFLRDFQTNVIGPDGVKFQSKVLTPNNTADTQARKAIEKAWREWCLDPCVTGGMSYVDAMQLVASSLARDGQVYIRIVRNWQNKSGFAIQLVDADMLDETFNISARDADGFNSARNRVVNGKEVDRWDRVVAYHFFREHPDNAYGTYRRERVRIPAEEIIDVYVRTRIGRFTGLSLLRGAIEYVKQLKDFEAAELVAAKAGACAFASIEKAVGSVDDEDAETEGAYGGQELRIEPGSIWSDLPAGWAVKYHKAEHPNTSMEGFRKAILRGCAAALGVAYNTLAHDLEGVSYSALREGRLRETDVWKMFQGFFIRNVEVAIFNAWLWESLLHGSIAGYNMSDFARLQTATWQGKRWPWVDPLKESNAQVVQLNNKLQTVGQVLAERDGTDLDEFLEELELERKAFASKGIEHPSDGEPTGVPPVPED